MIKKRKYFFWLAVPLMLAALVGVVMVLWNAVLPTLFQTERISYLQAGGLLLLCRILFGRWGPPGGPNRSYRRPDGGKNRMHLSDEERQRIKEAWKRRCGKDFQ